MAKKYTYSKTVNLETFTAVEFDSFDEAITAVNKGVRDRFPEVTKEEPKKEVLADKEDNEEEEEEE